MTDVDSNEIEFQCPSCGNDLKQTEGAQAVNDVMRVPLLHVARRRKSPRNRLLKDNK